MNTELLTEDPIYDKNGKQIQEFDLLKVFHFKGRNEKGRGRKLYYMYKWVRMKESDGKMYYSGVDLSSGIISEMHSYWLGAGRKGEDRILKDTEIIQSPLTLKAQYGS